MKKALTTFLQTELDMIQQVWGFNPDEGSCQIFAVASTKVAHPEDIPNVSDATLAYGRFMEIRLLGREFGLNLRFIPEGYVLDPMIFKGVSYKIITKA